MTLLPADRALWHLADAKVLLRVSMIYVLPSLAVLYVVLCGLWLVPDGFAGMYGNHDGHWASWSGRGILEWSGHFDFSPFSPLVGTGSLFAPNLPWLNPGALALAIPAPLAMRHLASMLVYLTELVASLYLLYRHFEFSREQSFLATLLYVCIFFIPFWGVTQALPWYALAPMNAHLIAAMNVATIALIRVGYDEGLVWKLIFGLVLVAALFVAFASAPVHSMTYVPTYAVLWIAFLIPSRAQGRVVLWRCGALAFALLVLAVIGVPSYLAATAMTSAREGALPPIFHPGWRLLSPAYWQELVAIFPLCYGGFQLMCPSAPIGWFETAVLAGAVLLSFASSGAKRRYGLAIVALLVSIHFYALLSMQSVLGRLHVVSTPFLMWAFFPLAPPAAIAAGGAVARWIVGRRAAGSAWTAAAASWLIAVVAIYVWVHMVQPYQPRSPGRGPLGLAPIAHVPANKGPIVDYLERQIGLKPGGEFRGYAATFLGAPDGFVRKATGAAGAVTLGDYVAARDILINHFGNSFQMMDLWNSDIPTFEEYGQWVSKQMFYFNRDLLAQPYPFPNSLLVYVFRPLLLRALGVRFVIADGTLTEPSLELVMTETGTAGAAVNLYEIRGPNLGQFSPTQMIWTPDYRAAVAALREQVDFDNRVVLLGAPEAQSDFVSASRSRLMAIKDGYHLVASAPGRSIVVLPVQFSHCWQVENAGNGDPPRVLRANVIQTGILFKDKVDVRLRFDFEPWRAACRLQDASDLTLLGFK